MSGQRLLEGLVQNLHCQIFERWAAKNKRPSATAEAAYSAKRCGHLPLYWLVGPHLVCTDSDQDTGTFHYLFVVSGISRRLHPLQLLADLRHLTLAWQVDHGQV